MKFIETKRDELRRERIALNEKEWPELRDLLLGAGEKLCYKEWGEKSGYKYLSFLMEEWGGDMLRTPTITLAELKAKYFEEEQRTPKVGDWGYFWDYESDEYATFGQLKEIKHEQFHTVDEIFKHFSHTIPPHIQELMKEPQYEVVYSFGESEGEIVVVSDLGNGYYAGTRGGVNVVLKRVER